MENNYSDFDQNHQPNEDTDEIFVKDVPAFRTEPVQEDSSYHQETPKQDPPKPKKEKKTGLSQGIIGGVLGGVITCLLLFAILFFTGTIQFGSSSSTGNSSQTITIDSSNVSSEVEAVAQIAPQSVVGIYTTGVTTSSSSNFFGYGTTQEYAATGSGFIVTSDGYIVTNQHVVGDNYTSLTVYLSDDSSYDAKVIWSDSTLDMAVLKIDATGLTPMTLGNSEDLRVGQTVIAIGNPLGLSYSRTVTSGIISALNRSLVVDSTLVAEDLIQTDAAINSGNSGGPLLNTSGEVIGINTYKASSGEGIGFAIPIDILKPVLNDIISTGSFNPVSLGISGYDKQTATYLIPTSDLSDGIYISSVESNSPAAKAGLQAGDVLLQADGTDVNTVLKLKEILYYKHSGDTITLTFERNGKTQTVEATL